MLDDGTILLIGGLGELLLLVTGVYAIYYFFKSGEIDSLILGISLSSLAIFGIVHWIIKKESFFTQTY
jgi:hypothetical protein